MSSITLVVEYILQTTTASISFISSVVIMLMIKRATLSSPYRRIIFGLSFGDAMQSFAMITGPFLSVKGKNYPWAVGNVNTCSSNGFAMVFGSTVVPMYLVCLSCYYFCKLNKRMSNEEISQRFEKKAHILINSSIIIACLLALVTDTFNPIHTGAICHFARSPLGCGLYPETFGECKRGIYAFYFIFSITVGLNVLCFLLTTAFMILLTLDALRTERIHTSSLNQAERSTFSVQSCACFCYCQDLDQQEDESDANYVLRLYRRETTIQAFLYISSYFITYSITLFITISGVMNIRPTGAIMTISAAVYPLMGFFNILIYTRPKVNSFRYTFTEFSWLRSFILVIKAGGEVPDFHNEDPNDLKVCCCCPSITTYEVTSDLSEITNKPRFSFFSTLFRFKRSGSVQSQ